MHRLKCGFLIAIVFFAASVKADSPLTSTYFATYYYEYPIVGQAESLRIINDEIAAYLLDENNPVDVKAAVINAIGWNYDGADNAKKFKEYLAKAHGISTEQINLASLRADELMCLGYLMAMDDYFVVDDAINILQIAAEKKKAEFTIHMILCLAQAQKAMDTDFCKVWKLTSALLSDNALMHDMKSSAIQSVVDYMILYKQDCTE